MEPSHQQAVGWMVWRPCGRRSGTELALGHCQPTACIGGPVCSAENDRERVRAGKVTETPQCERRVEGGSCSGVPGDGSRSHRRETTMRTAGQMLPGHQVG